MRIAAAFLSKTELKFDLVSAVDELAAQIKLEFDFQREARIMDSIAEHLKVGLVDCEHASHCLVLFVSGVGGATVADHLDFEAAPQR